MESGWCVSETKRHNKPFKGTITSAECGFPFITFSNADKVIGVSEINSSVDPSLASCFQKIIDHGERVTILPGDFVQSSKIDA